MKRFQVWLLEGRDWVFVSWHSTWSRAKEVAREVHDLTGFDVYIETVEA